MEDTFRLARHSRMEITAAIYMHITGSRMDESLRKVRYPRCGNGERVRACGTAKPPIGFEPTTP